jgi:hypothetical protein
MSGVAERSHTEEALAMLGRDASVRAEALEPPEFVELVRLLA